MSLPRKARKKVASKATVKKKAPRCSRCERAIRVPEGWSAGSAIRRHYWAKHRDVMLGEGGDA